MNLQLSDVGGSYMVDVEQSELTILRRRKIHKRSTQKKFEELKKGFSLVQFHVLNCYYEAPQIEIIGDKNICS